MRIYENARKRCDKMCHIILLESVYMEELEFKYTRTVGRRDGDCEELVERGKGE